MHYLQTLLARRCHAAESLAASLEVQLRALASAPSGVAGHHTYGTTAPGFQVDYTYKPNLRPSQEVGGVSRAANCRHSRSCRQC